MRTDHRPTRPRRRLASGLLTAAVALATPFVAPPSASGTAEPEDPSGLVLRGATLVDGTGAPARGPVDIVVRGDRIARVQPVGAPGAPIDPEARPEAGPDMRELDVSGMYVLPGLIDLFGASGNLPAEYVGELWMGHGVTTVRDPACRFGGVDCRELRDRAAAHELAHPRVVPFFTLTPGDVPHRTPEEARSWVREAGSQGAAGVRVRGGGPDLRRAVVETARDEGLLTSVHHVAEHVARIDVLDSSAWGAQLVEHAYGVPEALLPEGAVQSFPAGYNHADEGERFAQLARLWRQTARPGSARWDRVLDLLVERDVTLVPTLALYEANRHLMSARRAEWHPLYTLPELWRSFAPTRTGHATHWFYWTTADEIAWRRGYRRWMELLHDFHARGGRVAAGSDAGYMYTVHGFANVRELELLQEAGLHPLEVVRAATLAGAEALGLADELGSVEPGKRADLLVVEENPLENFKVLYGTGALKVDAEDRPVRVGGVRYTVKDGVVYDAGVLLDGVRARVAAAWDRAGGGPAPVGMGTGREDRPEASRDVEPEGTEAAGPAGPAEPSVELEPCELPRYEGEALCGTHEVYENRRAGEGRTVELHFAVLPATGDDPAPDPVVVLPGGPGQGALDQAALWHARFREMRRKRDLLLFDPRGTGRSDPLVCPLPGDDENPQSFLGDQFPPEALVACRKELDADPRFYTTPLIADDLDELRAALGYERLNLYGTSYGTRVALVYLRRHPEHVRVGALNGVVPPDMATPLYHAPDAQRALEILFDQCESDPACSEAYPDLREKFWAVEERLAEEPVEVELEDPKTGREITVTMTRHLFNEEIRFRLYDQEVNRLPKLIQESYRGDFSGVAALLLRLRRVIASSRTLVVGMYLSVTCTEDVPFIDPEEAERLAEGTFLGTHRVEQQRAACEVWPRGRLPEGFREPVHSSKPVLIFSGYRDPVTPPRWGEKVLRTLSAGRHVVVRQGFHFGAGKDSCVRRLLTRFIEEGSAEDLDTSCARHGPAAPFVLPDRESEDKEEEEE